jgi:hypothetical protein
MRLILRTRTFSAKEYFVQFNGSTVVGWFAGNWLKREVGYPPTAHLDAHFCYPADGNYHFSYKAKNDNFEQFISVYWNRVTIKTIENGKRHKENIPRDGNEPIPKILTHPVPTAQQLELESVDFFYFGTLGINVINGSFTLLGGGFDNLVLENDVNETVDLVVDLQTYDNHNVNMYAIIRRLNDETIPANGDYFSRQLPMSRNRVLELACSITRNPVPLVNDVINT